MEETILKVELEIVVTDEDIDDIMCGALEGGICYWCNRARVVGEYLGEYASEQISAGGELELFDAEEDTSYVLNKEKLLKGIEMYSKNPVGCNILEQIDGKLRLDCCNADAEVCDAIVQYALFGEIVFG